MIKKLLVGCSVLVLACTSSGTREVGNGQGGDSENSAGGTAGADPQASGGSQTQGGTGGGTSTGGAGGNASGLGGSNAGGSGGTHAGGSGGVNAGGTGGVGMGGSGGGAGGTGSASGITDIDGNVYTSVQIGTQTWMVGNLKTTRLNDGTMLKFGGTVTEWAGLLTTPGYCWPNNDAKNKDPYGPLYNFAAVGTGKLAPPGWHVATDDDWKTLVVFLGGPATPPYTIAGPKLYNSATNFMALGSGYRDDVGVMRDFTFSGGWWTSTAIDAKNAIFYYFDVGSAGNYGLVPKGDGFSVRCVQD